MEFSIKLHTIKSGWSNEWFTGSTNGISCFENRYRLVYGADPNEMLPLCHFIWVFTVCHSILLRVLILKWLSMISFLSAKSVRLAHPWKYIRIS